MSFLEKLRNKIVRFLYPYLAHFFLILYFVLFLAVCSIPETYWQIRMVLLWLWIVNNALHWAGTMERDYLPIQPGYSLFYHVYRFISETSFLFFPIFLVAMLIPALLWLKIGFCGVLLAVVILRAVGDRKYRPKKP